MNTNPNPALQSTHQLSATPSCDGNNLQAAICNLQSSEVALLGALLNRGRKVRRLPKFDQLTPAHFSNPLHAALLVLYRQDKNFSQTHNLQARVNILKSQPAFSAIPDHRVFLENLMISESDPVQALRSLLEKGPIHTEHSSIQLAPTPSVSNPPPTPTPIRPIGPLGPISENSPFETLASTSESPMRANRPASPTSESPATISVAQVGPAHPFGPFGPLSPFTDNFPTPQAAGPRAAFENPPTEILNSSLKSPAAPPPQPPASASKSASCNVKSAFKRKLRSDSAFAQLTDDQHLQLQVWLHENSYHKVVKLVAKPAPEGFGIKTHVTSLCRYFYATMHDDLLDIRADIGGDFKDLAALCQADPIAYRVITRENLERHLMVLSSDPKPNFPLILRIMRALQRDQEAEFRKSQAKTRQEDKQKHASKSKQGFPLASMNAILTALAQTEQPQPGQPGSSQPSGPIPVKAAVPGGKFKTDLQPVAQSCTHLHTNSHSVSANPTCNGPVAS